MKFGKLVIVYVYIHVNSVYEAESRYVEGIFL